MLALNFTSSPVLRTDRLTLRQLETNDAAFLFELRSNPDVNTFLDRNSPATIDDAIAFIQKINESISNKQSLYWIISKKDTPELIGTICLWNLDTEKDCAEIGFELLPPYQGKGFMGEAIKVVMNYAFDTMKVKTLEAWPHEENLSSKKVIEKNGFVRDFEAEKRANEGSAPDRMQIYSIKK